VHRGIAQRAFERRFSLADYMKVTGANLDNGMLHVDLVHKVPEAAKPPKIEIGASAQPLHPPVTEQKRLLNSRTLLTGRPPIGGRSRFEAIARGVKVTQWDPGGMSMIESSRRQTTNIRITYSSQNNEKKLENKLNKNRIEKLNPVKIDNSTPV